MKGGVGEEGKREKESARRGYKYRVLRLQLIAKLTIAVPLSSYFGLNRIIYHVYYLQLASF